MATQEDKFILQIQDTRANLDGGTVSLKLKNGQAAIEEYSGEQRIAFRTVPPGSSPGDYDGDYKVLALSTDMGSGTQDYIPIWTDSTTLGDSIISNESTGVVKVEPSSGEAEVRIQSLDDNAELSLRADENSSAVPGVNQDPRIMFYSGGSLKSKVYFSNSDEKIQFEVDSSAVVSVYKDYFILAKLPHATTDTDRFLVSDSGAVKYRTGSEVKSDIGATGTGDLTGSGTDGYIARWTGSKTLGNSIMQDDGDRTITIGTGEAGKDYRFLFDGESHKGSLTFKEDEDRFELSDDLRINGHLELHSRVKLEAPSDYFFCAAPMNSGATAMTYVFSTYNGVRDLKFDVWSNGDVSITPNSTTNWLTLDGYVNADNGLFRVTSGSDYFEIRRNGTEGTLGLDNLSDPIVLNNQIKLSDVTSATSQSGLIKWDDSGTYGYLSIYDKNRYRILSRGTNHSIDMVYYCGVQVVNTTASTFITTSANLLTIPANTTVEGQAWEVKLYGYYNSLPGPQGLRMSVSVLGSPFKFIYADRSMFQNPSGPMSFVVHFIFTCYKTGVSGEFSLSGAWDYEDVWGYANTALLSGPGKFNLDTTQAIDLRVEAMWSSASPSNSLTCEGGYARELYVM